MEMEKLYTPREVAVLLGVREGTLSQWRVRDSRNPSAPPRGPRFVRVGRRAIRYPESSLRAFVPPAAG